MSTKFTNDMWRMPRNANQSKSSNYSWNYSVNAKFNISSPANAGITSSISFWFKRAVVTNVSQPYEINNIYGMWMSNTTMYIRYGSTAITVDSAAGLTQDGLNALTSTDWVHWVLIREATATSTAQNFKMYANTKEVFSSSSPSNFGTNNTEVDMIWATNQSQSTSIDSFSVFNYALSPSQITTLYGSSSIGIGNPMSLSPKPVAYYSLGEYEAYNGASYLTPNGSLKDYVFEFNVPSGGIDRITLNQGITLTGNKTFSAWINLTTAQNSGGFLFFGEASTNYYLFIQGDYIYIKDSSGLSSAQYTPGFSLNTWYHICISGNGTNLIPYVNGSPISGTYVDREMQSENTIGSFSNGTFPYRGEMSNIQIWDTNLSGTEVTTLYNYGSPIQTLASIPQNSNLKAWYKLDASEIYNSTSTEWEINNALSPWTSSLDFNSNSYLSGASSISPTSQLTLSAWVNMDSHSGGTGSNELPMVFSKLKPGTGPASGEGGFALFYLSGFTFRLNEGSSQGAQITSNVANTLNTWEHIAVTYNGSNMKIFVNGILRAINSYSQAIGETSSQTLGVGVATSLTYGEFPGKISNAQIWYSALTDGSTTTLGNTAGGEVAALYNSGAPLQALASIPQNSNLKAWWQMNNLTTGIQDSSNNNNNITNSGAVEAVGSVSTLNGTSSGMTQANLVQSDLSFTSSYSSYALDFDGTNDKITGTGALISGNGSRTISLWYKTSSTAAQIPFSLGGPTDQTNGSQFAYCINRDSNTTTTAAIFGKDSAYDTVAFNVPETSDGNWHHLLITYDQSALKVFVDGNLEATPSPPSSYVTSGGFTIGGWSITDNRLFDGELSNVSVWNTSLTSTQVTEIYNEGVPSNLNNHSAYSNLVSWWQLGSNTYWADPYWIALDEKGTNNGQSQNIAAPNNMGENAIVDGVGSYANAVSVGLGALTYLAGEAPYSTANAKSINMGVTARGTDVP